MSADDPKPPPFYCPACGKKHRADFSALQSRSTASARVTCARCDAEMTVRMGEDGLPKCEVFGESSEPTAPAPAVLDLPTGGAMSWSSVIVPVVVSAIVAAVVGLGVGQIGKKDRPPAVDAGRIEALEQEVKDLLLQVSSAQEAAERANQQVSINATSIRDGLTAVNGSLSAAAKSIDGFDEHLGTLNRTILENKSGLEAKYKALNGRIEGNYTDIRRLEKRVKTLEGE